MVLHESPLSDSLTQGFDAEDLTGKRVHSVAEHAASTYGSAAEAANKSRTAQNSSPGTSNESLISAELAAWLRAAGLTDKKLHSAIELFEANQIEDLSDLRDMFEDGTLDTVGLAKPTLSKIKKVLGATGSRPWIMLPAAGSSPTSHEPAALITSSINTEVDEVVEVAAPAERRLDQPSGGRQMMTGAVAAVRAAAAARAADKLAVAEVRRAEQKVAADRHALHDAATAGDEAEVRRTLAEGCDINWVRLPYSLPPCFNSSLHVRCYFPACQQLMSSISFLSLRTHARHSTRVVALNSWPPKPCAAD